MSKEKILILILLISGFIINSCGYKIYTKADLPFQEVYLRNVENLTLEPGLQDKMRSIAYQKLIDNGFTITSSANRVIDIQITNYQLLTMSEIGYNTVEYQVVINVKTTVYDAKGNKLKEFNPGSPFITFFRTTRDLQSIIADKSLAIESLIQDICDDMMRRLIFEVEPKNEQQKDSSDE
ncbi:MAG TPA: LPS assembly lipoprotein LptE [Thermodesulfovibrio thiophilus]|uniref:LPS assembly lipoprotein LptE n=1 Tax=Thermodesulfovibrio thiophilus TaxID=340095 RepID=UPI0004039595|nr:LPS assembly lipoprotein LptE [Thermodesulfovibrio thiophilus]HOA82416.1 LPS assembly lipoprotein LptE [Thermodesulfovibrio thiophilus]HQA04610.1 LPS assembly lipoprotein LptE [Thermodesulfovibrio thiophilus]HQD36188.1 LPS assembly lipoprotein LptE [Thermodesulfovibrio thiophilus]